MITTAYATINGIVRLNHANYTSFVGEVIPHWNRLLDAQQFRFLPAILPAISSSIGNEYVEIRFRSEVQLHHTSSPIKHIQF